MRGLFGDKGNSSSSSISSSSSKAVVIFKDGKLYLDYEKWNNEAKKSLKKDESLGSFHWIIMLA